MKLIKRQQREESPSILIIQEGNRGLAHHKVRQDLMRQRALLSACNSSSLRLALRASVSTVYTHRCVMLGEAMEGFPPYLPRCYSKDLHNFSRECSLAPNENRCPGRGGCFYSENIHDSPSVRHAGVGLGSGTRPQRALKREPSIGSICSPRLVPHHSLT